MITCKQLTKRYGTSVVLNNINLTIGKGEFVSLIGVSGAGKTTLLEAILGNIKPDSGEVIVKGRIIGTLNLEELQHLRRSMGVVFQDYMLLPDKTVAQNIAFALETCGSSDAEIIVRVNEVLQLTDMVANRDKFPDQLSGGEKQRTALARALVHNPEIILADEPTGNLDPHQSEEIIRLLMRINEYGVTVILATHDRGLVNMIEKRVITLHAGEVIRDWKHGTYSEEIVIVERNDGIEIIEIESR